MTKKIEIGTYIASSAAIENDYAYFGNYDGVFFKVDLKAGKIVWQNIQTAASYVASPAVQSPYVVIGSQSKEVFCIHTETGVLARTYKTLRKIESSAIIGHDKVLVASTDGRIYILDLKTGTKIRSYEAGIPIIGTPAILDGLIVVATQDGTVFEFGGSGL